MKVADVMTRNVISVVPDATILEAIRLMLQHHISGLPVIDSGGNLVGIVTEGDFLRRSETGTERKRPRWLEFLIGPGKLSTEYVHSHGRKIEDVMTAKPATITENSSLDEVVRLMEHRRIKRLPVMRDGRVVGIVSRANLLHALASLGRALPAPTRDDSDIRGRILAEIDKQPWAPGAALIDVMVHNGTVGLWGTIFAGAQAEALKVLAENVPGVKAVEDHLAWIDLATGMVIRSPEDSEPPPTTTSA